MYVQSAASKGASVSMLQFTTIALLVRMLPVMLLVVIMRMITGCPTTEASKQMRGYRIVMMMMLLHGKACLAAAWLPQRRERQVLRFRLY